MRCARSTLHVPTHALSTRSLPRAGPCSTMAAIILHLLSLHMVRTPLLYFVRAAPCFSHVHNLKRALEAVTCLERATQAT